ncbi:MAG: Zn-dependent alcohol dehydrogenase [Candidatus Lambdaproteobacteria bacterium]|nr:Zn-dependent alcohol dehydrogenase [Candidatus Lambdaproteobacteria bacterium]
MKMKAAVMYEPRKPMVVEVVELDPPKAGEVLVKMSATGICHSDLHFFAGDVPTPVPVILGHEGAGVVQDVGAGVSSVKKGDKVVLSFFPSCGVCRFCLGGQPMLCDVGSASPLGTMPDGTRRVHRVQDGSDINNFSMISTFAEYTVAPEFSVIKVDAQAPLEKLCLLGCGFTTGFGSVTNAIHIRPGDTVTCIGCGGVGLSAIQGAALSGASKIIAVDVHESKLALAKKFGATHAVLSRGDVRADVKEIRAITDGLGSDYALELVGGAHMDTTAAIGYRAIRKGGTLCLVGIGATSIKALPIDPLSMVMLNKTVKGVFYGQAQVKGDIPRYYELYKAGKINLDDMVSKEMRLEDINAGFEAVIRGDEVVRQVIRFS